MNVFQFGADTWAQQQKTGPSQENIPHPEAKLQDLFCFKLMLQEISTEKRNSTCVLLFIEYFCCLHVLME